MISSEKLSYQREGRSWKSIPTAAFFLMGFFFSASHVCHFFCPRRVLSETFFFNNFFNQGFIFLYLHSIFKCFQPSGQFFNKFMQTHLTPMVEIMRLHCHHLLMQTLYCRSFVEVTVCEHIDDQLLRLLCANT